MVAVIHLSHFFHDGGLVGTFLLCEGFKMFAEMMLDFFSSEAANVGVTFIQRNVRQVVQIAEKTDFRELRNPCEHGEADVFVAGLQVAVKGFQDVSEILLQWLVVDGLKQRFVVFVDKDDNFLSGFGGKIPDKVPETLGVVIRFLCDAVCFFQNGKVGIECFPKAFRGGI